MAGSDGSDKENKRRKYPSADVKILWARAAGRCAFPGCRDLCVQDGTAHDGPVVLGKIAHIAAHSDDGPRSDPGMPLDLRDSYGNWILLCGKHHDVVDGQENTYTSEALRLWKKDHEEWVRLRLVEAMPEIGFAELDVVTKGILNAPLSEGGSFDLTAIREKMKRNKLSPEMDGYFTVGLSKAREVGRFVDGAAQLDPGFPDELRGGFVRKYEDLRGQGADGDALFEGLYEFAVAGSVDFRRRAAGLAVLVYLFEKCEVFEK